MNNFWVFLFLFLSSLSFGQKVPVKVSETNQKGVLSFYSVSIPVEARTPQLLLKKSLELLNLPIKLSYWQFTGVKSNPFADYYNFRFAPEGRTAVLQHLSICLDKKGTIRNLCGYLEGVEHYHDHSFGLHIVDSEKIEFVFYDGTKWQIVYKHIEKAEITAFNSECFKTKEGEVLWQQKSVKMNLFTDTLVKAKVFLPDPLTTAGVTYGGAYQDFNDADTPALNNERYLVDLKVKLENGLFKLSEPGFEMVDVELPTRASPEINQPLFDFTRAQDEFEFVNAYYHLQTYRNRVHQYGFNSLPGFLIWVDPQAANGQDVSAFTPDMFAQPTLLFGTGGIDDAEDADVIVHEFAHALAWGAAPNTFAGFERASLEEGFADYFAMSYSRSLNPFNWQKTFNWDGNLTWSGREANANKFWPKDRNNFSIHANGEIWVATLADIFDQLGRETTDKLMLGALFNLFNGMTFRDLSLVMLQQDSLQNAGKNQQVLLNAFNFRGTLIPTNIRSEASLVNWHIRNTIGFAQGQDASLYVSNNNLPITLRLYNGNGQLVKSWIEHPSHKELKISGNNLSSGIYILKATNGELSFQFKLMHY